MNDMVNKYKYFAFISYNSNDLKWGKRLQKKLKAQYFFMKKRLKMMKKWLSID